MPSPDTNRRAHALLTRALERPLAARSSFIRDACSEDPALADEATRLVRALESSDGDPTQVPPEEPEQEWPSPDDRDDRRPGNYCLLRVLGAGGSAIVYEATQDRPRRSVAVKVMRRGLIGSVAAARFELETEVLARLHHPGIAQIYEAGIWERDECVGTPFYAMELVPAARTITAFADEHGLDLSGRIELFLQACNAVQHGHALGIIHRDLKPGNILVGPDGRAKVIDFGIARSGNGHDEGLTAEVSPQAIIGTLNYMAPEQCRADKPVSIACDVYSLGVVLFELLCGRLPHDLAATPLPEACRRIQEDVPTRPSDINPALRGDLDAIVTMALAKDPEQRYPTAEALAADLRRSLADEAVIARPPTLLAQTRRFARRHKGLVASLAAIAVAAAAAVAVSLNFARHAAAEAKSRSIAEAQAIEEREAAVHNAYVANLAAGFAAWEAGESREVRRRLDDAPEAHRGWEWRLLRNLSERAIRTVRPPTGGMIFAAAMSADEASIAIATSNGRVARLDSVDGATVDNAVVPGEPRLLAVSFASDGRVAISDNDGGVWIWDGGEAVRLRKRGSSAASHIAWLPDGRLLAVFATSGGIILDDEDGEETADWLSDVHGLTTSRDRSLLVTWTSQGTVDVRRSDTLERLSRVEFGDHVAAAALSEDHAQLAVGGRWGAVRVWNLSDGTIVREFATPGEQSTVQALAFSPDGTHLAVGQVDRRIFEYDLLDAASEPEVLLGHEEAVSHVDYAADGRSLRSTSWDGTVREWGLTPELRTDLVHDLAGHEGAVLDAAFAPDGTTLATAGRDGSVQLWDAGQRRRLRVLHGPADGVYEVAFSPDGLTVAAACGDGAVRLWNVADGTLTNVLRDGDKAAAVWTVAFSADGRLVAASGQDGVVRIWNVADGVQQARWVAHAERVLSLVFHPRSSRLATSCRDGRVRIWKADGTLLSDLAGHTSDVFSVIFDESGDLLISGSRDQSVRVWDTGSGACLQRISANGQFVTDLALSPDGSRLAASSWFGRALIFETDTWTSVASIQVGVATRAVAFSRDGDVLATTTHRGTTRLFDAGDAP